MTTKEMAEMIGKKIKKEFGGLQVEVQIVDAKICYGNLRYLVTVVGQKTNSVWINA